MKKCIIYGTEEHLHQLIDYADIIAFYEEMNQFEVVGFVSTNSSMEHWGKYRSLSFNDLLSKDYDYIVVIVAHKLFSVCKYALVKMGIPQDIIIPCVALTFANFSAEKYQTILQNPPSIFVNNCWGGITYNSLGLQFTSPLINMFESAEDYLKFMGNLPYYLEQPVELDRFEWEQNLKREYPVGRIDDVLFHFNHYESFEEALDKWDDRKSRINFNNILAVFYTQDRSYAEKFSKLPYERKVCFVPFVTDIPSLAYVDIPQEKKHLEFYQVVNQMASGEFEYYDVLELLAYGRFQRL